MAYSLGSAACVFTLDGVLGGEFGRDFSFNQDILMASFAESSQLYGNEILKNVRLKEISKEKGRGLFAKRDFNPGELVFTESPLFAKQHEDNKGETEGFRFCYNCLCDVRVQRAVSEQPVPVFCECGEVYCSENCKNRATPAHVLLGLCSRRNTDTEYGVEDEACAGLSYCEDGGGKEGLFRRHAFHTNEMFLMAGQAIAMVVHNWRECRAHLFALNKTSKCDKNEDELENMEIESIEKRITRMLELKKYNLVVQDLPKLTEASFGFDHIISQDEKIVERCLYPIKDFRQKLWWEVVEYDPNDDTYSEEEYRSIFKQLCIESLEILKQTLLPYYRGNQTILEKVLTAETYGCLMGLFEMNNISIEYPLETKADFDTETSSGAKCENSESDNEDSNSDYYPGFEGVGLFTYACMMNHSCYPNVMVTYPDKNSKAYIMCKTPIKAGDELCISYIDADTLSKEERQKALVEYGFMCSCKRCVAEGA